MRLLPNPTSQQPFLHLCGTLDFCVSQLLSRDSPSIAFVPFHTGNPVLSHPDIHRLTRESLYDTSFSPCWQPMDKMFAAFGGGEVCIPTWCAEAWDGLLEVHSSFTPLNGYLMKSVGLEVWEMCKTMCHHPDTSLTEKLQPLLNEEFLDTLVAIGVLLFGCLKASHFTGPSLFIRSCANPIKLWGG